MNILMIREAAKRFGWSLRGNGGYEIEYVKGDDVIRLLVNGFNAPYAAYLNGRFFDLANVVGVMTPAPDDDDPWTA